MPHDRNHIRIHDNITYGTADAVANDLSPVAGASADDMSRMDDGGDLELTASRSTLLSDHREKPVAMRALGDRAMSTSSANTASSIATQGTAQVGVQEAEAIARSWGPNSLALAYLGIALLACATSLESLTTSNLTVFATSAFNSHSLVSTVLVIQGVVLSVAKPPISKFADVFGRLEAFCLAVLLCIFGYLQQALSTGVGVYAAAQLFYSAGTTGLQILIQIFIADTSDLLNRALFVTLPDLPFMFNIWLGPPLAELILRTLGWRWGYALWAAVLPVCFVPLAISLAVSKRRAARRGLLPASPFKDGTKWDFAKHLWVELDLFGLFLICASFSLILIPMTLGSRMGWNHSIIAMLLVGIVCLIAFPFWERNAYLAPRAFFPRNLLENRTVLAGFGLAFFYFMAFYMSVYPYFQSYLLVVMDKPLASAGRILQTFTFASTLTSLGLSFIMKRSARYKRYMVFGTIVYILGLISMYCFRQEGASTFSLVLAQAIVGMGGSLIHLPAQIGVQAAVSHQQVAATTALFLTILEIGGAVGSAISGAMWTNSIPNKLEEYLPPETRDLAADIYGNITLASTGWPMGSPTRRAINRAYQETMTKILMVAVCVAAPCFCFSLLMRDFKLDNIDQHTKKSAGSALLEDAAVNDDDEEGRAVSPIAGPSSEISHDMAQNTSRREPGKDEGDDGEEDPAVVDEEQPLVGTRPGMPRGASLFQKFRRHV